VRLVWTTAAKNDLGGIIEYIWFDNPPAAKRIRSRIEATAEHLAGQPHMGRTGAIVGTREAIPHPSDKIVYQVTEDAVTILRVIHTARQWPPEADSADEDDS